MKISIDDNVCMTNDISKEAILVLAAIQYGRPEIYEELVKKGLITKMNGSLFDLEKKYTITNKGIDLVSTVILDSDTKIVEKTDSIKELAIAMREIYPSGRMAGTSYYYRSNISDIEKKLKSFFKRYGDSYTNEQILDATRKYVESFNGNYVYLKLLKYFIWKDEKKDGETIQSSMLADWIENEGDSSLKQDWTSSLN